MYTPSPKQIAAREKQFAYHNPNNDQLDRFKSIRAHASVLADFLIGACPDSRELSLALTKLEESVMWAELSIARNE